jgi:16S rRNA (guanine527-N7)-methyltransferase
VIRQLERAAGRPVPRETFERIELYIGRLRDESRRQNLISASTFDHMWDRHILDSAQIVRFEPRPRASWVDIGSGAGLPGIVVACLVEGPVTLVEPRKLRAQFLLKLVDELGLNSIVECAKAEKVGGRFDVITARAVAPLTQLLRISHHLSTKKTVWALPKGRGAQSELAEARTTWQGVFHVERSVTDPDSCILVATGVRARAQ